jgi:hypothetical protein
MARFDSGVAQYIVAKAEVKVYFPVDYKGREEVACKHCQFYVRATQKCGLNGQVVNYPEHFVGELCPLVPVEEEEKAND